MEEVSTCVESQAGEAEGPAALHHPCAGWTVTVMRQLHLAWCQAVIRHLILPVKGIYQGEKVGICLL